MPKNQVMRFQMIAPSSPPRMTFGLTMLCSIIPPPIALATASVPVNAAAKLKIAAQNDRGKRTEHARADDRGDGVRRIVEAVAEVEDERDQDDRDDVGDHGVALTRS